MAECQRVMRGKKKKICFDCCLECDIRDFSKSQLRKGKKRKCKKCVNKKKCCNLKDKLSVKLDNKDDIILDAVKRASSDDNMRSDNNFKLSMNLENLGRNKYEELGANRSDKELDGINCGVLKVTECGQDLENIKSDIKRFDNKQKLLKNIDNLDRNNYGGLNVKGGGQEFVGKNCGGIAVAECGKELDAVKRASSDDNMRIDNNFKLSMNLENLGRSNYEGLDANRSGKELDGINCGVLKISECGQDLEDIKGDIKRFDVKLKLSKNIDNLDRNNYGGLNVKGGGQEFDGKNCGGIAVEECGKELDAVKRASSDDNMRIDNNFKLSMNLENLGRSNYEGLDANRSCKGLDGINCGVLKISECGQDLEDIKGDIKRFDVKLKLLKNIDNLDRNNYGGLGVKRGGQELVDKKCRGIDVMECGKNLDAVKSASSEIYVFGENDEMFKGINIDIVYDNDDDDDEEIISWMKIVKELKNIGIINNGKLNELVLGQIQKLEGENERLKEKQQIINIDTAYDNNDDDDEKIISWMKIIKGLKNHGIINKIEEWQLMNNRLPELKEEIKGLREKQIQIELEQIQIDGKNCGGLDAKQGGQDEDDKNKRSNRDKGKDLNNYLDQYYDDTQIKFMKEKYKEILMDLDAKECHPEIVEDDKNKISKYEDEYYDDTQVIFMREVFRNLLMDKETRKIFYPSYIEQEMDINEMMEEYEHFMMYDEQELLNHDSEYGARNNYWIMMTMEFDEYFKLH